MGLLMLRLGSDRVRLVDLLVLHADRLNAQVPPPFCLSFCVLRIGLGLLHRRLHQAHGDLEIGRVDRDQQVAFVDELVIDDGQFDDAAGDLRRYRDDVGAHRAVARPGPPI